MARLRGIVVVDRLGTARLAESGGALVDRAASTGGTAFEVFRRYRGFDGVLWPNDERVEFRRSAGVASFDDIALVEKYVELGGGAWEAIGLLDADGSDTRSFDGWHFAGYDVGFFESEWSHFSIVLNEVVWGTVDALRGFGRQLNPQLLFSNLEDCHALLSVRGNAIAHGKDLEVSNEPMVPFAIFLHEHTAD